MWNTVTCKYLYTTFNNCIIKRCLNVMQVQLYSVHVHTELMMWLHEQVINHFMNVIKFIDVSSIETYIHACIYKPILHVGCRFQYLESSLHVHLLLCQLPNRSWPRFQKRYTLYYDIKLYTVAIGASDWSMYTCRPTHQLAKIHSLGKIQKWLIFNFSKGNLKK